MMDCWRAVAGQSRWGRAANDRTRGAIRLKNETRNSTNPAAPSHKNSIVVARRRCVCSKDGLWPACTLCCERGALRLCSCRANGCDQHNSSTTVTKTDDMYPAKPRMC
eukprot:1448547-Rhodomonas_salina.3